MSTKITAARTNLLRSALYSMLGTTSTGYGAGLISRDVSIGQTVNASSYRALIDDLRRCWIHQTGGLDRFLTDSELPTQGSLITESSLVRMVQLIEEAIGNKRNTVPSQQLKDSLASSTSTVYGSNSLTYVIDYSFTDNADANYFFNLGGSITAGLSHAGGTYIGDRAAWANFIVWANSQISSTEYTWRQWNQGGTPNILNIAYTSSTFCTVQLRILAKDNRTITTRLSVNNTFGTVNVPTTATSVVTYSDWGPSVQGYYGVPSPRPQASIVTSFGSGQIPPVVPTKILTASQPTDFTFPSDSNSYTQTITVTNAGNSTCTVSSIVYPAISNITTDVSYPGNVSPPWSIDPGGNHTFDLRYFGLTGLTIGTYNSSFSVYSDAVVSPVTINTRLVVTAPVFDFVLDPVTWTYTYTHRDSRSVTQLVKIGGKGDIVTKNYVTDANFLARGFSIKDSPLYLGFDFIFTPPPGLSNGTYSTTVNVVVNGVTHPFTATITLAIPTAPVNQHLGDWVSALQKDNGVIGASYDIINDVRCITLGFGMDANGGGNVVDTLGSNVNVTNLGIGANADANFALGPVLYPGPGTPSYSDFLKPSPTGHGVWVNDSGWYPVGVFAARTYGINTQSPGMHIYTFAADNQAYFIIDGIVIGDLRNNFATLIPYQDSFYLSAGNHTLTVYFYNADNGYYDSNNNPGSMALTIVDPYGISIWDSNLPVRTGYTAYQYWNEVCRIPLYDSTATDAVFYSKDYLIKNLSPLNGYSYGSAFGYAGFAQEGSMFTIIQDPYNNITITLNPKYRELTDKTTNYASYLFYYYTGVLGNDRLTQLESNRGDGQTLYFTGFDKNGTVTTSILKQPDAPYIPPTDVGRGSVSVNAYMPYTDKLAGTMLIGDSLLLLTADGKGTLDGTVISNRISQQKLLTLVSSSGIRLTCSDNTPLTLQDGSCINSTEAAGNLLPVQDKDGFRWEEIVEVIDAGIGNVATIFCNNQCYAAGDEPERWIWTHNIAIIKV
jgi:hypothetical protein